MSASHRIVLCDVFEAQLPWRRFPGRLVSRSELVSVLEATKSLNPEDVEEVVAFVGSFIQVLEGEVATRLLENASPPDGEALAIQPVPAIRTADGLFGVVQQDTIASLRSSLPRGRCEEVRSLLSDWLRNSPERFA